MNFCPHCGFNLSQDAIVERDGFTIDPRGTITFNGRRIKATPIDMGIAHSVASAAGRVVKCEVIAERLGSETNDPRGLIRTRICFMRKNFADARAPFPLETVFGRGYRWGAAA